jgi:hypothetical protein
MKKTCFLTGILGLALVFVLAFTGCPTDGGDGGGGGGGGGDNPLLGTWVNDNTLGNNFNTAIVFTNAASTSGTAASGTKIAYYATNLTSGSIDAVGGVDTLNTGGGYQYTVDVTGAARGEIIVKDYIPANNQATPAVPARDVTFKRAEGTTGNGLRGIWVADLPAADAQYATITLIGSGNKVWSLVGQTYVANYLLSDTGGTSIKWDTANFVTYDKDLGLAGDITTTVLTIPLPGAGTTNTTLRPIAATPTF